MAMTEQEILDIIQSDYSSAEILKNENDSEVDRSLRIYNSEKYGNEEPGKSQFVSSMVKQNVSWQLPSLVEPFTSTEDGITCEPVTYEDVETAEQAEQLLNYQYARNFDRFSFISDLCMKTITEGTCFVKASWETITREVTETQYREEPIPMDPIMEQAFMEQMQMQMQQAQQQGQDPAVVQEQMMSQIPMQTIEEEVTYDKTIINRPTAEVCDLKDVRVDPTCRGIISKAQFITYDFESDVSSLEQDGRYINLDKLDDYMTRDSTYVERDNVDSSFVFTDEARKRFIVHEYWGNLDVDDDGIAEPMVFAYVGDVLIYKGENPLDDGTKPFFRAVYERKPGYIYGTSLPIILEDMQRIDSVLHRGIFDDMKRANNGQRGYKKGFTDEHNLKKFKQGKDYEFNTSMTDIWEGKYTGISQSVFSVMQENRASGDASSGVKPFAHGQGGNSLGSTAAAVNATTTSSAKREMQIIRGISEDVIIPMLELWLAYDALFLEEEEVIRVTNKEFIEIKRDDLDGNIDIQMSIATQESKAMKADRLAFLLQTTAQGMGHEERSMIIADLMEINDMPHLAEKIKNTPPPQPSPEEQEVQMLQVELLKAQVQNEYAKAKENEIDFELKTAKRDFEVARTRKMESDADMTDLDYLRKDHGKDQEEVMAGKAFDRGTQQDKTRSDNLTKIVTEREKAQQKVTSQPSKV